LNRHLKALARRLFGDYSVYQVYASSGSDPVVGSGDVLEFGAIDREQVKASPDELIATQASYHQRDTFAFAWRVDGRIAAVCYYWHGPQYRTRNFWPLADDEAKLVQVVTAPEFRGRGLATNLIVHSSAEMHRHGFRNLYARIWHSNTSSLKAFRRAGWTRVATVIEVFPLQAARPVRLTLRAAGHTRALAPKSATLKYQR
jgi:RimJ/RimL family protein N-acetyltransferase